MELALDVTAGLGIVAAIALATSAWPSLPERIPIHFGITGLPDGWGSKRFIFMWPVMLLLIVAASFGVSHALETGQLVARPGTDIPRNVALLAWIRLEFVALFLYVEWLCIEVATRRAERFQPLALLAFIGIVVATTVLFFAKI